MAMQVPWAVKGLVDQEVTLVPEKHDKKLADALLKKVLPLVNTSATRHMLCNVAPDLKWRNYPPSRKSCLVHPGSKEDVVIQAVGVVTEVDHVMNMSPAASNQVHRAALTIRLLTSAQWDGLFQFLKTYECPRNGGDGLAPEIYSFPVLTRDAMIFDVRGLAIHPILSHKLQVGDIVLEDLLVERVSDLDLGTTPDYKTEENNFWRVCWKLQMVFLLHRPDF